MLNYTHVLLSGRRWASPFLFIAMLLTLPAQAQPLVLDEEFNQFCHTLTKPLRQALVPGRTVNFVLVNDPAINAFVTPENLVFIHSGLVRQAKSASELQGVLAHELGHLAAGHLQQKQAQAGQALLPMLAGAALGVGAAVAGAPQAGVALALGGQAAGVQTMLNFSRVQEQEADQSALQALHGAGLSASGMVGMFNTLRTQSQLSYDSPPPWLVTHPLPAERLARLTASVTAEDAAKAETLAKAEATLPWARVQAKVAALTESPASVLRRYNGNSAVDGYAQALAQLRLGKLNEAQQALANLLKTAPNDPYYLEVAGQIALQRSDLKTATANLTAAVKARPDGLLLRYQLAEVLRAQNNDKAALAHYSEIVRVWPIWSEPWASMGRSMGKLGRIGASHLAFAEAALADGDLPAAKQSLALAQNYLKKTPDAEATAWAESVAERSK